MGFTVNFNAAQVAPSTVMEAVPTGIYTVMIDKSEEKAVRDKPGNSYGQFSMRIQEGEHVGKYIIARLNLKNDNAQAMEIAQAELSAICHVTGVMMLNNTQELHGRPFKVNVVKVPMTDRNGEVMPERYSNEIRGYLDMNGNAPAAAKQGGGGTASNAGDFGGATTETKKDAPPPAPKKDAPPAPAKFPPEGWTKHPDADGYYYKGQEVITEAELRKRMAADAPKAPPPAPSAPKEETSSGAGDDSIPDWAK